MNIPEATMGQYCFDPLLQAMTRIRYMNAYNVRCWYLKGPILRFHLDLPTC